MAVKKDGVVISKIVDRLPGQVDVVIPGGFYYAEAIHVERLDMPKTKGMADGSKEVIPHLTVTDVTKNSTTVYPVNWAWQMKDTGVKYGEQKLCYKNVDGETVDQRISINVYYYRGEEPDALETVITPLVVEEEEAAPMPGDDTAPGS